MPVVHACGLLGAWVANGNVRAGVGNGSAAAGGVSELRHGHFGEKMVGFGLLGSKMSQAVETLELPLQCKWGRGGMLPRSPGAGTSRDCFSSCIYQLDRNPAMISEGAGWKSQQHLARRQKSAHELCSLLGGSSSLLAKARGGCEEWDSTHLQSIVGQKSKVSLS